MTLNMDPYDAKNRSVWEPCFSSSKEWLCGSHPLTPLMVRKIVFVFADLHSRWLVGLWEQLHTSTLSKVNICGLALLERSLVVQVQLALERSSSHSVVCGCSS